MLFLAVFCGFLAEYKLEQTIERHREKEYMQLMLEDLKKDTANINTVVTGNHIFLNGLDTLMDLLSNPQQDKSYQRKLFVYSLKYTYWYMPIQFSEITLSQLKYSGGFRLIKNRKVASGILQYDQGLDACKYNYDLLLNYYHVFEATNKELFNMGIARSAFNAIEKDFRIVLLPYDEFEKLKNSSNSSPSTGPRPVGVANCAGGSKQPRPRRARRCSIPGAAPPPRPARTGGEWSAKACVRAGSGPNLAP